MWCNGIARTVVMCIVASAVLGTACATFAESTKGAKSAADNLPGMCKSAQKTYKAPTKADIRKASAALDAAVKRLDARLNAAGPSAAGWRSYLQWKGMKAELAKKGAPDPEKLGPIHAKFSQKHEGLGLVWFQDVRDAMRLYINTCGAVDNPKLKDGYVKLLDDLATHLESHAKQPTAEESIWIGLAMGYLSETRQAGPLVAAIRRQYCRPNLFLQVSEEFASAGMGGPITDTSEVEDVILGATIIGTGRTKGEMIVELVPNRKRAAFETVLRGVTQSQTVGYKGPVRIFSDGTTSFTARKRFQLDQTGIDSQPATSNAQTETTTTGIQTKRGSRIVENAAWKKVCKSKSRAECIGARHAEQRINERVDSQAEEMIADTNDKFKNKFRKPLVERDLFPQLLRFNTTADALRVMALRADNSQLAAATAPPKLMGTADLGVQVHESIANNMAESAFGGITLREEALQKTLKEMLGELPERLKPEEGREPWAITFAGQRPISIAFGDNTFSITIRAKRYYKGEAKHPGMNVSVTYKIVEQPSGFKAIRQGDLEILPPGFVPGKSKSLSARYTVIRNLLERRFSRIFEEEIVPKQLVLKGKWKKAGTLSLAQWQTGDGWMVMSYSRAPAAKKLAGVSR